LSGTLLRFTIKY